jgi:hypothetical protein
MALPTYSAERRREIATQLGIDEQYIYQVMKGLRMASPALARKLHDLDPSAELKDLRPNDWLDIWPELAEVESVKSEG